MANCHSSLGSQNENGEKEGHSREVNREEVMRNKSWMDILVKQKGALNPFHASEIELLVEGAAIRGLRARNRVW